VNNFGFNELNYDKSIYNLSTLSYVLLLFRMYYHNLPAAMVTFVLYL